MDDLPVLPAYRPLSPLDDTPVPAAGTPAAPQLAPRQLEQQHPGGEVVQSRPGLMHLDLPEKFGCDLQVC